MNVRPEIVHKVVIRKSVNSFVARKSVHVVYRNLMRPAFVSKPFCNVPIKLVKCKFAVNLFGMSPIQSKVACRPVCNVSNKPIKSKVSCKRIFNIPAKSINSNVACKSVSNVSKKNRKI